MVNIKVHLEALLVNIDDLKDTNPDQICSLTNFYFGITAKLKNLYALERNAFIRAVHVMNEEDKVTLKKLLRGIGRNFE